MSKPKRIVKHGCYSASNKDLGIKDKNGKLMEGKHDVFVVSKASKKGFVKVKTITSLENVNNGMFHNSALNDVKKGKIIPIPVKLLNSSRLSGINRKPIWIHKSKLNKSKYGFKYPLTYNAVVSKDSK